MTEFISERFKRGLLSHVVVNSLKTDVGRFPLIYGIHGAPGDGKTFQVECVLKEYEIMQFLISGGELENYQAGEPSELIRRTYRQASDALLSGKAEAATVVINDIDAAIGDWGELVQYTVNRQSVFSELMNLCDFPNVVGGRATRRVPIIITGNNFNRLYQPLMRPGRMRLFEWVPTLEETIEIVSRIFHEMQITQVKDLIVDLNKEANRNDIGRLPISFYSDLKLLVMNEKVWEAIEPVSIAGVSAMCNSVISSKIFSRSFYHYDDLVKIGMTTINSMKQKNHLEK